MCIMGWGQFIWFPAKCSLDSSSYSSKNKCLFWNTCDKTSKHWNKILTKIASSFQSNICGSWEIRVTKYHVVIRNMIVIMYKTSHLAHIKIFPISSLILIYLIMFSSMLLNDFLFWTARSVILIIFNLTNCFSTQWTLS